MNLFFSSANASEMLSCAIRWALIICCHVMTCHEYSRVEWPVTATLEANCVVLPHWLFGNGR